MTLLFYFMIFLCENELFQRGWGVGGGGGAWGKLRRGQGGISPLQKWKIQGGGGALSEIPSVVCVWILNHSMWSLLMNVACKESSVR